MTALDSFLGRPPLTGSPLDFIAGVEFCARGMKMVSTGGGWQDPDGTQWVHVRSDGLGAYSVQVAQAAAVVERTEQLRWERMLEALES